MEIWKDIHGFKDYYQVSNFGNIRSKDRIVKSKNNSFAKKNGRPKKAGTSGGYKVISLSKNGKEKCALVHRLVGFYFVKGRSKIRNIINHKDGDKLNNNDWNLEWCTQKENIFHSHSTGLQKPISGDKHHFSKITNIDALEILKLFNLGVGRLEISNKFNLSYSSICRIIKGTQRK